MAQPGGLTLGFATWNSLPAHIRSIKTLSTFKRHLKFHLFPVPILRFKVRSTDAWRARRARAYNGGLRAEPQAGSRGRAPGQRVRGAKPPEAESLLAFQRPITARKITSFTVSSKLRVCDVSSTFKRIPNISLLKTG